MPTVIHPTAIVEKGAQLGADCEIMAGAIVTRHCVLGDRVVVHPYVVLGGDPQYLKFDRAIASGVRIGAGTVLREHVTINRSIQPGGFTTIGDGCFFMAASHAAHDCAVGNQVVLANGALLKQVSLALSDPMTTVWRIKHNMIRPPLDDLTT